jgi:UDP-N-acetylmuramoyl-tripeptide--D-alanyl-D-alanine ligase
MRGSGMVDTARIRFSLSDVRAALGVEAYGTPVETTFTGVSTDSRTAQKGDLFVALSGDTFDGHDFVPAALHGGVSGIIVRKGWDGEVPAGVAVFAVDDTLAALGELARYHRARLSARVVGITGSNGKTTTKEIAASVARTTYRTVQTEGNLNNLVGLPMTLLSAPADTEALILEMGMNVPGEIGRLAEIAAPDIGVVTNVGPVHLEGIGSIEGVIAEKGVLPASLKSDGIAIFEGDADYTGKLGGNTRARLLTFGLDDKSDVRAEQIEDLGQAGTRATFVLPTGSFAARISIPGVHNLKNALAAAAVGLALDIPIDRIAEGIRAAVPMTMRMEITGDTAGLVILNDSYNANPVSMRAALEFLARLRDGTTGRSIAVLGDMLELGDFTRPGHEQVGAAAARLGIDLVYVIGEFAEDVRRGAVSSGQNKVTIRTYPKGDDDTLTHDLLGIVRPGDAVLVKGSRAMRMERIAHALLKR